MTKANLAAIEAFEERKIPTSDGEQRDIVEDGQSLHQIEKAAFEVGNQGSHGDRADRNGRPEDLVDSDHAGFAGVLPENTFVQIDAGKEDALLSPELNELRMAPKITAAKKPSIQGGRTA